MALLRPEGILESYDDTLGNRTTYRRSPDGLNLTITDPRGAGNILTYDLSGFLESHVDPWGVVTKVRRDGQGRVTEVLRDGVTLARYRCHVSTERGGAVSATAVKARLQMLLDREPADRPLSDQELAELLRQAGIVAARRTVAKYRESLGIGSSSERRRLYRRGGARAWSWSASAGRTD